MKKEELKKLESTLWQTADTLRANSDLKSSEYSTPVLGIIFLRFADNKYCAHEKAINAEFERLKGTRRERKIEAIAIEKCGFYLPPKARYDYLLHLPEKEDSADAMKQAMKLIEKHKPELKDTLPQDEYFRLVRKPESRTIPKQLLKNFADKNTISSLYEACKPDILEGQFRPMIAVFQYLRSVVDGIIGQSDIEAAKRRIDELLDQSVVTAKDGSQSWQETSPTYKIVQKGKTLDLSKINFDKLKEEFKAVEHKHIEISSLRGFIEKKLEEMLKDNSTRTDFAKRLQDIINQYNAGGMTTENYYDQLVDHLADLKEENERHIKEHLTKDELELFDILKKEKMTKAEEVKVKNAAKHLLKLLTKKRPKVLVQDWFKDGQSRERVKSAVLDTLNAELPDSYDRVLFQSVSSRAYDLIYEYASKGLKWAA